MSTNSHIVVDVTLRIPCLIDFRFRSKKKDRSTGKGNDKGNGSSHPSGKNSPKGE
ncbi:MAG: hypothetical protein ABIH23_08695 [bacterium]